MSYLDGTRWGPGAIDDDGHNWSQFLDDRDAGHGLGGHQTDDVEHADLTCGPGDDASEPGGF